MSEYFDNPTETPAYPGDQRLYAFPNGWAASVVRGQYTYGGPDLWELAVIEGLQGSFNYDTPITDDVIGWLDESEVDELLVRISELPNRVLSYLYGEKS